MFEKLSLIIVRCVQGCRVLYQTYMYNVHTHDMERQFRIDTVNYFVISFAVV